ncbi:MAG: hypothetical protein QM831_42230 [Kofleriaceae bacterium]
MGRIALVLAFAAMFAAGLPAPGLYVAIGLGIAAMGCGLSRYRRRDLPGAARLVGAAAITVGALGLVLGLVRVVLVLGAIDKIDRMLP